MSILPGELASSKGDRFHTDIFDFLVFCSMLWKAADSTGMSKVPPGANGKVQCQHLPYEIVFDAHGPAEMALHNQVPDHIRLHVQTKTDEDHPFRTEGTISVTVRMFSAIFAIVCEGAINWQRGITTDVSKWPPVLAFCRVIRNAIAHDGKLRIDNPKPPPVAWRGLAYGYADNGRPVIGPDLGMADLLILLFDLDEELTAIGAPGPLP